MILLLTAVAGGLGAAARFLLDSAIAPRNRLPVPLGTLVVNTSACFLLGVVVGATASTDGTPAWATVAGTGFLGGYSTFSTASVEGARLFLTRRAWPGAAHALGMLVAGMAAAAVGLLLGGVLAR